MSILRQTRREMKKMEKCKEKESNACNIFFLVQYLYWINTWDKTYDRQCAVCIHQKMLWKSNRLKFKMKTYWSKNNMAALIYDILNNKYAQLCRDLDAYCLKMHKICTDSFMNNGSTYIQNYSKCIYCCCGCAVKPHCSSKIFQAIRCTLPRSRFVTIL